MSGDEVCKPIPINELHKLKLLIDRAKTPLVQFNDDFEIMRIERDSNREYYLNMMLLWLENNVDN